MADEQATTTEAAPAAPKDVSTVDFLAEARAVLEQGNHSPAPPEEPVDGANPHPDKENPAGEGTEKKPEGEGTPPSPPDDVPSQKLKRLMDREGALVQKEQDFRAHEEELAGFRAAKKRWQDGDPDAVFDALGVNAQDAMRRWMAKHNPGAKNQPPAPEPAPKPNESPELRAMREELEGLKAGRAQDQEAAARAGMRAQILGKGDEFELVNIKNLYDDVWQVMRNTWGDHPQDTPFEARIEKAAAFVEKVAEDEWLAPLAKSKKAAKLGLVKGSTEQGSREIPSKTVTNSLSTATPPPATAQVGQPDDYYIERARRAMNGSLP